MAAFTAAPVKIVFAHYGALRSMNAFDGVDWAEIDGIITLGDPWPNVAQAAAEAALLGLSGEAADRRAGELAAAELTQTFGRIRAPRRARSALLLHVGRVLPLDWHAANATIELRPEGRPPQVLAMGLAELEAALQCFKSQRAFARAAGISASSVRQYLSGGRTLGEEHAARIRTAVELAANASRN